MKPLRFTHETEPRPTCDCCGKARDISEHFYHCFNCHKLGCESVPFNGRSIKRCELRRKEKP